MKMKLDHILWGAADLDDGARKFAALTGVEPITGGTHPGFGTRNRLVSLGPDTFFEVISPDLAQPRAATGRAADIAAMPRPGLLTFAIQTDDINEACAAAERAGLAVTARRAMTRTRPDGVTLAWTVAQFGHPEYAGAIPFAIDWQGSPHPSTTTPGGCTLRSLTVLHPEPAALLAIYRALGLDVAVQAALRPGLIAVLASPKGDICLTSAGVF